MITITSMCDNIRKFKRAFLVRFYRKPMARRVMNIMGWSLGLIITALLLSGHFVLAATFVTLVSLTFLAVVLLCKKIEEIMANACTYFTAKTVDALFDKINDASQADKTKAKENTCSQIMTAEDEILGEECENEQRI